MASDEAGYPEVNAENYRRLQLDLARKGEQGSEVQIEFLKAAADTESFLMFLQERGVCLCDENSGIEIFDRPLTEQSFREMPARDEAALYDGWSHVPPRIACRQPFWAHVTLHHLRCEKLRQPTWLALNGQVRESGAVRVHHALKTGNAAEIDACTRTILRRVAGLRTVRGVAQPLLGCAFRARMVARAHCPADRRWLLCGRAKTAARRAPNQSGLLGADREHDRLARERVRLGGGPSGPDHTAGRSRRKARQNQRPQGPSVDDTAPANQQRRRPDRVGGSRAWGTGLDLPRRDLPLGRSSLRVVRVPFAFVAGHVLGADRGSQDAHETISFRAAAQHALTMRRASRRIASLVCDMCLTLRIADANAAALCVQLQGAADRARQSRNRCSCGFRRIRRTVDAEPIRPSEPLHPSRTNNSTGRSSPVRRSTRLGRLPEKSMKVFSPARWICRIDGRSRLTHCR